MNLIKTAVVFFSLSLIFSSCTEHTSCPAYGDYNNYKINKEKTQLQVDVQKEEATVKG